MTILKWPVTINTNLVLFWHKHKFDRLSVKFDGNVSEIICRLYVYFYQNRNKNVLTEKSDLIGILVNRTAEREGGGGVVDDDIYSQLALECTDHGTLSLAVRVKSWCNKSTYWKDNV